MLRGIKPKRQPSSINPQPPAFTPGAASRGVGGPDRFINKGRHAAWTPAHEREEAERAATNIIPERATKLNIMSEEGHGLHVAVAPRRRRGG